MGSGISPPVLSSLVRIAEEIGGLYGKDIKHLDKMYQKVDALVANGCQCAIFIHGTIPYGYVYQDEKIFYDSNIVQGVLFPGALELLGFSLDETPF